MAQVNHNEPQLQPRTMTSLQTEKGPRNGADKSKSRQIRRFGVKSVIAPTAEGPKLTLGSENYQIAMHTLDQYLGTTVTCRYAIPSRLASSDASEKLMGIIEDAISQVILRHPLFQVGILGAESKRPVWVRLDGLDLRQHIEWRFLDPSEDLESLVHQVTESELNSRFPSLESRPGWKVIVLHERGTGFLEIMLNFNHVNADGIGAKIFHEDLLECLNSETSDVTNQHLNNHILRLSGSSLEFPPPTEKWCKLQVDARYVMKILWEAKRPPLLCKTKTQANWAPIRGAPYTTRFRSFNIEAGSLARLLITCRKHNTTITGLLHSLAFISLASYITTAAGFQSGTPLDLRRYLPRNDPKYPSLRPERTVANYVTVMDHEFPVKLVSQVRSEVLPRTPDQLLSADVEKLVWSTAAKVRADIRNKLALGTKNDPIGVGKFVQDWQVHLSQLAAKPRQHSWLVTNLGVLDGQFKPEVVSSDETVDSWSIRSAQFTIPTEVPSAAIMISPASVVGGQLCVGCSWQDSVVDENLAINLMADMERWLLQLAS